MNKYIATVLLSVVALGSAACHRGGDRLESWSGTIEAIEVDLAAEIGGRILELAVQEGDRVAAGELIATLDVEKIELQKREAEASLAELARNRQLNREKLVQAEENFRMIERDLARFKTLYSEKTATQKEYDDINSRALIARSAVAAAGLAIEAVDARVRVVRARLDLLDRRIADGEVAAPMDGYVVEKFAQPGEIIGIGAPIVRIADLSNVYIKIYLAETEFGRAQLNGKARLRVDSFPERDFVGRIAWISPEAEFTPKNVQTREARVSLVYAVKVELPNPDLKLKIGMPADVYLDGGE